MKHSITPSYQIALFLFIIAALFGFFLRLAFAIPLPDWFQYISLRHAHSHVALLGWLFAGLNLLVIQLYDLSFKRHKVLYLILQTLVLLMIFSFCASGYSLLSVLLTTSHLLLSYLFLWRLRQDIKQKGAKGMAHKFIDIAYFFFVLSSLGTLSLGVIQNIGLTGSEMYYFAIQFYLHFLLNGFLFLGGIGLFIRFLELNKIKLNTAHVHYLLLFLVLGTCLTIALPLAWSHPAPFVFLILSIGASLQLIGLYFAFHIFRTIRKPLKRAVTPFNYHLLSFSLFGFVIKIILQAFLIIPSVAKISYTVKNFVIGFIHLLFLACLSTLFFALYSQSNTVRLNKIGISSFLIGVVGTESLLFIQGLFLWQQWGFLPYYYEGIAFFSAFIPIGLFYIFSQKPNAL